MFNSEILEVAIGVIFVFLLMSIICSSIREGIESWLKTRAAYLEHGIRTLLNDKEGEGIARDLYQHPMISSLFSGDYDEAKKAKKTNKPNSITSRSSLPSYIPSKNFAVALMDIAARGPKATVPTAGQNERLLHLDKIRANVTLIQNADVQRALLAAIDSAQGDLDKAQKNIEAWYDSSMDRISGWYRRSTQWIIFWLGAVVAVIMNVNIIRIADHLYRDDATRSAAVARASAVTQSGTPEYAAAKTELESLTIPIGWTNGFWPSILRTNTPVKTTPNAAKVEGTAWDVLFAILGWFITAVATTMGAPFWFDILNKVMVIRSTVKPNEKSPPEGSEDRQPKVPQFVGLIGTQPVTALGAGGVAPAAQGAAQAAAPAPLPVADPEKDVDACDVNLAAEDATSDEQLPASEGGVQS